jgi:lipopolysaccharide transport system ATP-binding protein
MGNYAIKVENLGKKYAIGAYQGRYKSLRDSLSEVAKASIRRIIQHNTISVSEREIWALKNVSFEIKHGEVVGIIGRNGAGKSTLLKILARITEPTTGEIRIRGRVGSLLEVGTGFHPELTGRENILLNGAILGMRRNEIQRKFDEIVDFAEIEKFIDTPAKHYSSGMYMRLAFAVAAHLEPEVLLIDEVLAVGDLEFQKKCLGKMGEVAKQGRTVLFVSHNMGAVNSLCEKGIYLEQGKIEFIGEISTTIEQYLHRTKLARTYISAGNNENKKTIRLLSLSIEDENEEILHSHPYDEDFYVKAQLSIIKDVKNVYLALHIHDDNSETIIFSRDFDLDENKLHERKAGIYNYRIHIPGKLLVPGSYSISFHIAWASPPEIIDGANYVCPFEIIDNTSVKAKIGFPWRGKIAMPLEWELE